MEEKILLMSPDKESGERFKEEVHNVMKVYPEISIKEAISTVQFSRQLAKRGVNFITLEEFKKMYPKV